MQLKDESTSIRGALAAATCSLLGLPHGNAAAQDAWQIGSTVLYYQESDNRVTAIEPVVSATRDFGDEKALNLRLVVDVLTGASPNGAAPSDVPQTFTRPSGQGQYMTPAGEIPLDDTFKDTRVAASAAWTEPLDRMTRFNVGATGSVEHDYTSIGINGALAHDINNKNTTLSAGAALSFDTIEPEGGAPTPFAAMSANTGGGEGGEGEDGEDEGGEGGESKDKTVADLLLGVTQVVNRRTLMLFNYGLTYSSGYHEDPYKVLSVVDGTTGSTLEYLYEKRPDTRLRNSVFWETKYHLTEDVIDVSYRYYWDDWGINSHTVDLRYRWQLSGKHYLEPHVRYYTQTGADFYRHSLVSGEPLPDAASADYRLADFNTVTLGLKYGVRLADNQEMSVRLEVYQQTGEARPKDAIGVQRNYDMYPDMTAIIAQISYSF